MTAARDSIRLIEALLFASPQPLAEDELQAYLPETENILDVLDEILRDYQNRGVTLVQRNGKWVFRTAEDLADRMGALKIDMRKLSRAAIEVLSVIAYHQPVTRAEIEDMRGVALSKGTMDVLFDAGWIRPRGRRRSPGKPMQWGTTEGFLDHFGLQSLADLPNLKELKAAGLLELRAEAGSYGNRAGEFDALVDLEAPELAVTDDESETPDLFDND